MIHHLARMTWKVLVKKGPWVKQINEKKWSMINAGVSSEFTNELKSDKQSFQETCHGIRLFAEAVLSSDIDLYGFKNSINVAKNHTNWAAHSKHDGRYPHTTVTEKHMNKLMMAFTTIVDHLIQQANDTHSSSSSESEVDDLTVTLDAMGIY